MPSRVLSPTGFPSEFQWILAFVIPLVREFNFRMMYRIMIDSPKVQDGKEYVIIGMNSFSALYVAIKLGHTTTKVTSILILAISFHVKFVYRSGLYENN